MAPLSNTALSPAISNHLSHPPAFLPPSFSSITTRDDASDAARAKKQKKEMIRNILIITLNPVTLIIVIMVFYYLIKGIRNEIRYRRQKKKNDLEELAIQQEWERQWNAQFGIGSNNYIPPKTAPVGEDGAVAQPGNSNTNANANANETPRGGFFSFFRWRWPRGNTATVPAMSIDMTEKTTDKDPTFVSEKDDTYARASNDTDRTAIAVGVAPIVTTDDEKKGAR
ncbi:uncharacterized protein SPSK_07969 [Sporothrix schenckii 1099-18]|uniref:Uncharacterized protein n=1 Tax=Sporothrix schenckii 1099-18 TaxID=1397361 RepID=A0A0F2MFX5_SPOSC|nr:uncharacterized protein SPSK_07969 [Sporothrix schenckii 1099-18]KJR88603.1 hypothetical protein SPSK_07969 [Sporothrix schenckii 1099-18]